MKYAVISDIHEDIISLRKVINQINKTNADKLVCLGDITGFSDLHHSHKNTKDADACIDLLKKNFDIIIAGNHDLNTLDKLPLYLKRHKKANSFLPKQTWAYEGEVHASLSNESIKLLNQLPEYVIETVDNINILFSHFLFPDITGSTMIIPEIKKELKPHFNFMERNNCLLSIVGHTHIDGFALSNGRNVLFKEFGFKQLSEKQQIIFGPAVMKDGEKSGFMIFDTDTFELSTIKTDT
ncbi:MAG: metallophosphatase family protein [Bacteroidales bacterium]|nr:metallophosphatase family protein [Bacteroidales bacterium]